MTTATTAKIISQAGKVNPPSLVALYGGTLGERKSAITEIENDLQAVGLNIIEFNARRYLSENDLCLPLVQQIVTELKVNAGSNGTTSDLVNRINESAPVILSTNLSSENRVEMIHQFDSSMKKLAAISIQKRPLVVTLQGIERAVSGSFTKIYEFISNYFNINGFMFIISVRKENLEKELLEANVNISPDDFLEDTYNFVAEFGTTNQVVNDPLYQDLMTVLDNDTIGGSFVSGSSTGAVNGAAAGALLYNQIKVNLGLMEPTPLQNAGGFGHVRRETIIDVNDLKPEVQDKLNELYNLKESYSKKILSESRKANILKT